MNHNVKTSSNTCLGDGVLKGITRLIVETDEKKPQVVAIITAGGIDLARGYKIRMKPDPGYDG